jgi:hypothetical protein
MLTKLCREQPYSNTEPPNHYANKEKGLKKKDKTCYTSKLDSAANVTCEVDVQRDCTIGTCRVLTQHTDKDNTPKSRLGTTHKAHVSVVGAHPPLCQLMWTYKLHLLTGKCVAPPEN